MTIAEAASRIVEIQGLLISRVLGTQRTSNLFEEQRELWDSYFLGKPYEHVRELAS